MTGKTKADVMRAIKGAGLLWALILAARATETQDHPATHPDYAHQVGQLGDGGWAARRVWNGDGGGTEDIDGKAMVVEASIGVIPGRIIRGGGWEAGGPFVGGAYGDDGAESWDIAASESEVRGVYTGERMRWMPTKSRYRTRKDPVQDDSVEIPLQEHQRRQRLQLQQQLLKRAPEGRRGVMQLENLGGGILVGDDEDGEAEEEDEEEERGDIIRSRLPPPPQPFGKLPALRPPIGTNEPTPVKPPSVGDLKSILKMTNPLSLSEILQKKNLSLEELLRGSRVALTAVEQAANTGGGEGASRTEQRRRRPVPTGSRPLLKRRRPTPPPEFLREPPSTSTHRYITTTQTTSQRTTTTSTTTEEPRTTIVDEEEGATAPLPLDHSFQSPLFTSNGDLGRDILEIILQEDETDGPSLADVLSSRNMTVADLIEQRERASGRSAITSLFPASSSATREWERRKGREESRKGRQEDRNERGEERHGRKEDRNGRVEGSEDRKVTREEEARKGRKFMQFDLTEADWDDPLVTKTEVTPSDEETEVEGIPDQQVTQTRSTYQIISSQDKYVQLPKPSEAKLPYPPKFSETNVNPLNPKESKITYDPKASETKISETYIPSFKEIPTFQDDGQRPLIRTRVTIPTSTEEILATEHTTNKDSTIHNSQREVNEEYEESAITTGLPEGVKSAIIASTSLLGIALLIFLSIFAVFRYRQWRRRRGMGPYLCVAVLEAAAGSKKTKGPKIVKQGKTKEKGWGDTFDSAQERLWRTLRRGRCRFYDHENGQM